MEDRFFVQKQLVVVPFGKRFYALDTVSNEPLFVHRFYKGDWDDKDGWHESFDEWVAALTKVGSPVVPRVISKGEDEDGIYVVLSRIEGISLADLVSSGRIGVYAVREFIAGLLEAGRAAAEVGIIHGAYDPRRITVGVGADGKQSYLVDDFGLPLIHQKIQKEILFLGLPPFTSVKQARGEAQDERGELFSIGQLMLYCFAAGHPYLSEGLADIGATYEAGQVPRLADFRGDLPADLLAWHETLSGVNGESGFGNFGEALASLPAVSEEVVLNVELIAAELTAGQTLTASAVGGVRGQPKLITGTVAVRPAEELMAQAGVIMPQQKISPVEASKRNKTALVWGGVVAGVLLLGLLIGFVVSNSGNASDQDDEAQKKLAEENLERMREKSVPMDGLLHAWNFNGDLTGAKGGVNWEALNRERYEEGHRGKGVVLGTNAYYQATIPKGLFMDEVPRVTLNFWFKAPNMWTGIRSILATKGWEDRNQLGWIFATEPAKEDKGLFRWNVSDGEKLNYTKGFVIIPKKWTMITVVKNGPTDWVLYQDGEIFQTISWNEMKNVELGRVLYLGIDSENQFKFSQDVVLDSLLIWERALSADEIKKIHRDDLEYFPELED